MKAYIKFISLIIAIAILSLFCSCKNNSNTIRELGNPTKEHYPNNFAARCVWDMEIYDGKLYVGNGNYDDNTGPAPVLYCNLDSLGDWKSEIVLNDEQIGRFVIIDGKLTVPGFDPCGDPDAGAYYQLENGGWNTYRNLPGSLHNFDIVKFDDKLFAGIGATEGKTSVMVSENGSYFTYVPMYKNGQPISTMNNGYFRTYDFFVLENKLYADLYYKTSESSAGFLELYRYENGVFVFDNAWGKKLSFIGCPYLSPIHSKAVINDTLFITTGHLYYTTDMNEFKKIELPNKAQAYDLYVYNDVLYILTAFKTEDGYCTTIYSTTSENIDDFKGEVKFNWALPPTSFAVNDDCFFIAMGDWNIESEQNGDVVELKRK
ncbi:MAG: hypothetical protein E7525_02100 [Ruminococcaceae bacterium]|nr:hypothetical protein [Oscillospiraceae bacterium]